MFTICLCVVDKNGHRRCVAKYMDYEYACMMLRQYRTWHPKKEYWLEFRIY